MNMYNVFVYGSLRKGFGNHRLIESSPNSKFIGIDYLKGNLYDCGHFPFFISNEDGIDVTGEIYSVDINTLYRLDSLEGYSPESDFNLYNRKMTSTKGGVEVFFYEWGYPLPEYGYPIVEGGDWTKYFGLTKSWSL